MDLRSGCAFWPIRDGLPANYPPLREDASCDVAVVGAGVTGALTAYRLATSGLSVIVLDGRDAATGSTAASTALLQYEIDAGLHELTARLGRDDAERCYRLCVRAVANASTLAADLGDPTLVTPRASLYLASDDDGVREIDLEYAARAAAGIAVERLGPGDLASAGFSFTAPASLRSADGAECDAYRLAHALLGAIVAAGGRVHDRTRVTFVERSARAGATRFRLATDRAHAVTADRVVYATGYEAQEGLKTKITALRSTYALATEPIDGATPDALPGWPGRCLLWETARPYFYARTTADGRILAGGEDEDFDDPAARDALIAGKTDRLIARVRAMFPAARAEPAYSWSGTFGETDDGLPYVGEPPERPGALFTLGMGGNGTVFSIAAADIIRDLILGRPNDDARLFRFDRPTGGPAP